MWTRLVAPVTVGLLTAVPAAAQPERKKPPAPRPSCLVRDATGDTSPEFDVTCVDVWVGKREVVVVLRLLSTNDPAPYETVAGAEWKVALRAGTVGNAEYVFTRERGAGVTSRYRYAFNGAPMSPAKESATEIRWGVPLSWVPRVKPGVKLTAFASTHGLVASDSTNAK